jgi:alpha-beta hydrolase superfamily lysophospholipase
MRRLGIWLGRVLFVLVLLLGALWAFGPRDRLDRTITFDPAGIPADIPAWLDQRELTFSDITPGARKEIVWAGAAGAKTPLAVVYIHGFSASKEEIRPVPDDVARALGANLFFTRLAGHGRTGEAMAQASAEDWWYDIAEAVEIGRRLGDRVVLIGTSTGATLISVAMTDPGIARDVAGVVLVSPNYALNSPAAAILDLPFAPLWGPLVAGPERSFAPANADHAKFWTTRYPTAALFPMATLMRAARGEDWGRVTVPALFVWSTADKVIDPAWAARVAEAWGGPVTRFNPVLTGADDPYAHVIAGRILSPGQTAPVTDAILGWAKGL